MQERGRKKIFVLKLFFSERLFLTVMDIQEVHCGDITWVNVRSAGQTVATCTYGNCMIRSLQGDTKKPFREIALLSALKGCKICPVVSVLAYPEVDDSTLIAPLHQFYRQHGFCYAGELRWRDWFQSLVTGTGNYMYKLQK